MTRRTAGVICMVLGGALLLGAAGLMSLNRREESRAGRESAQVMMRLRQEMEQATLPEETLPEETLPKETRMEPAAEETPLPSQAGREMPTLEIDGQTYIGYLELPTLGLSLPVMSEWSYPKLRVAPCRYWGSAYDDSLVILAHNYGRHFGRLQELTSGDPVQFIDADGVIYRYTVEKQEILERPDVEAMVDSGYDLTLFTCTYGGRHRVTVRLRRAQTLV